jgi:hypothetical protein
MIPRSGHREEALVGVRSKRLARHLGLRPGEGVQLPLAHLLHPLHNLPRRPPLVSITPSRLSILMMMRWMMMMTMMKRRRRRRRMLLLLLTMMLMIMMMLMRHLFEVAFLGACRSGLDALRPNKKG